MKKFPLTIIEITATHIRLFQFKSAHGKKILFAFEVEVIREYTDSELSKILKRIIFTIK